MRERRTFLRGLLSRLLAERSDSEGLYIPRGEEGMRRMIRHLIAMRPPEPQGTQMAEDLKRFLDEDAED